MVLAGVLTTMLVLGALMAILAVSASSVLRIVTPLADIVVIALYGLLYGPIALPCAAPLLVAMFGLSLSFDSFIAALAFFIAFGLGFGIPLLAISLLAYSKQLLLVRIFAIHRAAVSRVAEAVLSLSAWPT